MNYNKFTVCMSVYCKDKPDDFSAAIRSIYNQTAPPAEIILVVDGPIPDILKKTILDAQIKIPIISIVWLKTNMGHAISRQTALDSAKNELIAIMDSDDVAESYRFEKQLQIFKHNPELSIVGGLINEFVGNISNIIAIRNVPQTDIDIKKYLKSRCPMNLVTVMFRKSDVISVGGFMDWYCEEDYYLWIRLALKDYKFYNIQENLVYVRVGKEMYLRRGGWKYFMSEARLQRYMWDNKLISLLRFVYNICGRFIVQVAMPNVVRGFVFQKLFRKSK